MDRQAQDVHCQTREAPGCCTTAGDNDPFGWELRQLLVGIEDVGPIAAAQLVVEIVVGDTKKRIEPNGICLFDGQNN